SATPDVATFYQAKRGRYQLLALPERVSPHSAMPEVSIVDLREELRAGNLSLLSRVLKEKTARALRGGEQVIFFLNRRGAATFIQCRHCGRVFRCPRCQVALNYHLAENSLICHQCSYRAQVPLLCPECHSPHLSFLGTGIQKLEEEVRSSFPQARVLRWDSDTVKGRYAHEEILAKFRNHEADILIGTQMVASGLDLPGVTLVGVVSADSALNLPDFRAGERTFQLLCQVAGRAGRGELSGEVVIQSYAPRHYAISTAVGHNYQAFYEREINYRLRLGNPPFSHLVTFSYVHQSGAIARREAERLKRRILEERDARGIPELRLIGPAPAFIPRLRGRYHWQLTLRSPEVPDFLSQLNLGRGWSVDVDPMGLT
ncbi:MAG: primosomal protein N', partial [Chloroflexota bacterium]